MSRFFSSYLGRHPDAPDFYECTCCQATFEEWPGRCSDCDQLVVRIVALQVPGQ